MEASQDFDVHLQWLDIVLKRILYNNKENMIPLLCLSFINSKQAVYNEYKISGKLTINDLSTGFPYTILVNCIKQIEPGLSDPAKLFQAVLSTLRSLGYNPSNNCEISRLTSGSISDHVELSKIIEWAIVDKCLSIQMLCDDIKRLPRSFYILDHQPNLLEDAVALWLSKFPMSHTLPMIKDFRTEIFQGQHVAFSLSRVYPKRILKDLINVGTELTDLMITQNWEYAKPVMDELVVFVPPFRQLSSPHLIYLFFADIFYATRSGAKKFVRLDPPPIIITPRSQNKNEKVVQKTEDTIEMKVLRQQQRFHPQNQSGKTETDGSNNQSQSKQPSSHRHHHHKSSGSKHKETGETGYKSKETKSKSTEPPSNTNDNKNAKKLKSEEQNTISPKKIDGNDEKSNKESTKSKDHSRHHKKEGNSHEHSPSNRHRKKKHRNNAENEEDDNNLPNDGASNNQSNQSKENNDIQPTMPKSDNEVLKSQSGKKHRHRKGSDHSKKTPRATNSEGDTDNNNESSRFSDDYVAPFSKSAVSKNSEQTIPDNISNSQAIPNQNVTPQQNPQNPANISNGQNQLSNTAPDLNNLNNLTAQIPFQDVSTLPTVPAGFPEQPANAYADNQNQNAFKITPIKKDDNVAFSSDDDNSDVASKLDGAFMITPFSKSGKRSKSAKKKKSKSKYSSKKRSHSASRKRKSSSSDSDDSSYSSSSSSSSSDSSDKKSKRKSKKHKKKDSNKSSKTLPDSLAKFQEELGKFDLEAQIFTLEAKRHMLEAFTDQIKKNDQDPELQNDDNTKNTENQNEQKADEVKTEDPDMVALSICIDKNSTHQDGFTEDDIAKIKEALIKLADLPPNDRNSGNLREILNSLFKGENVTIDHVDDVYNKALSLFKQISSNPESIPQLMIDISRSLFGKKDEDEPIQIEEIIDEELILVDDSTTNTNNNDSGNDDNCQINQTIELPKENEIEEEEEDESFNKTKGDQGNLDQIQTKDTNIIDNDNQANKTDSHPLQMMMTQEVETEVEQPIQSNMETQTDEFEENDDQESSSPMTLRLFEPVLLFEKASINPSQQVDGNGDKEEYDLEPLKCDITIRHIPFRRFTSFNRKTPTLRNTQLRPNIAIISTIIRFNAMPSPQQDLEKNRLLEYLRTYKDCRLIVLLTTMGQKIKAIYKMDSVDSDISKIWGNGPHVISQNDVGVFFKYITGTKKFEQIPTKHLTQTTDALSLKRKIEPRNW